MSVLIKGMRMPTSCVNRISGGACINLLRCEACINPKTHAPYIGERPDNCPLVEVPTPHGRLIDADALRDAMYHEAFETDTQMQKWDSGCWVRYKMFEQKEEAAPTVIEAED